MARPPFADTHVHFHDMTHPSLRYAWLEWGAPVDPTEGDSGAIRALHYRAEDFLAETRFQNVSKVVHVQAAIGSADPVEETRWLDACARRAGIPHGIVAAADLAAPDVAEAIARHRAFPGFRGIRDLRDDDYLTNPDWERGFALLDGLVCCDDPFVEQMGLARALAERHPGVTLCIDHAGFPGYAGIPRVPASDGGAAWRAGMAELAKAPNVVVKISGLGMSDHAWTAESIRPWVLHCIEQFGVERAFFGTNWPLDRLYGSYGDVLDAYDAITADFTEAERHALFHGNAERIFRLQGAEGADADARGDAS